MDEQDQPSQAEAEAEAEARIVALAKAIGIPREELPSVAALITAITAALEQEKQHRAH
jgi:hypothetical protein